MIGSLILNHNTFLPNNAKNPISGLSGGYFFTPPGISNVTLRGDALVSAGIRLPGAGTMSASVFKPESFSSDNPIILVKGIDADGTPFEVEINVNNVDPRSASLVEMFALDGYFASKGQALNSTRNAVALMRAQESLGTEFSLVDAFTQLNFIRPLQKMMWIQRKAGNWEGFMNLKHIVDTLPQHRQN